MEFEVTFSTSAPVRYTGNSRYQIRDGGVLEVVNGERTRFLFSPAAWLSVKDKLTPSIYENKDLAASDW